MEIRLQQPGITLAMVELTLHNHYPLAEVAVNFLITSTPL